MVSVEIIGMSDTAIGVNSTDVFSASVDVSIVVIPWSVLLIVCARMIKGTKKLEAILLATSKYLREQQIFA